MDPIMAYSGYTPSSMALPGMMSRTEQMMMPYMSSWNDYVTQMDLQNSMGVPLSVSPCATQTGTTQGTNGSVFNMEEHLAQIAEQAQRMQQYQIQQQAQARQNSLVELAPMERLKTAAMDLKTKIDENEQQQITQALAIYMQAVRDAFDPDGTADPETIKTKARVLYEQQTGQDLILEIKENGHSPFGQGFINGATFGIFAQRTSDETISQITGQEVSTTSKNLKKAGDTAGFAAGGAVVGAVLGAMICGIPSGGAGAPAGAWLGAKLGAACGAAVGFIKNIL